MHIYSMQNSTEKFIHQIETVDVEACVNEHFVLAVFSLLREIL